MPNHCEQDLYVTGPRAEVMRMVELVQEGNDAFSANKVIPYPEEHRKADEAASHDGIQVLTEGGYQWAVKHWGSKWGAYESGVEITNRGATFHFKSAWAPIAPVIKELSRQFPKLYFVLKYYERGMAVKGVAEYRAGEVQREAESAYTGTRGG